MLRKFIASVILVISLHAQSEKFQILATNIVTKENNVIEATGNVVIFSQSYYLTAQKVIYDKEKEIFELFDDVMIVKDNKIQTKSNYAFLDIKNDTLSQKPTMFFDEVSQVWINSKASGKKGDEITIKDSTLSSCDCDDPDWSIGFSKGNYSDESKWINLYNPRFYFKNTPVFYFPYIGFSANDERKSGLLVPKFGVSDREGFLYSQPIFLANEDNYDFEITPQFRTQRGQGLYLKYRYADSINSLFELSTGYFGDKNSYTQKYSLTENEHYGVEIDYSKYNIFSDSNGDYYDGIFLDLNYANDIEYKILENEDYDETTEKKIESKINYIMTNQDYYLGSYFRYYLDTEKDSNSTTLQELPKLQAHSFSKNLFFDRLLYSSDFKYTNHFRNDGINANQFEVNLPISYSFSFIDNYFNFIVENEFKVNEIQYTKSDFENGTYIESNLKLSLNSDTMREYDDTIHSLSLSLDYEKPSISKEEGTLYNINSNDETLSPFPIYQTEDSMNFAINQIFYDKKSKSEIFNYKLNNSLSYENFNDIKLKSLENEVVYNYLWGKAKNRFVYSHEDQKIVESSTSLSFKNDGFSMNLGHYISKESSAMEIDEALESYQLNSSYQLDNDLIFSVYTDYNMKEKIRNKLGYKFTILDSCWNLDLKFEKEIIPASTVNSEPIEQDIVYFQLFLKPLGTIKQEY